MGAMKPFGFEGAGEDVLGIFEVWVAKTRLVAKDGTCDEAAGARSGRGPATLTCGSGRNRCVSSTVHFLARGGRRKKTESSIYAIPSKLSRLHRHPFETRADACGEDQFPRFG
jgi:hypothetical protein